jgi:hypothetical protein
MGDVGIFYGQLVHLTVFLYFMDIWHSLWKFGIFSPILVFCTKKIWQTRYKRASPIFRRKMIVVAIFSPKTSQKFSDRNKDILAMSLPTATLTSRQKQSGQVYLEHFQSCRIPCLSG